MRYLVYGFEKGESGTPHLQGYVTFEKPIYFTAVSKLLPRAHIEVCKGSPKQARDYAIKDGDYKEFGDIPKGAVGGGDAQKRRYEEAFAAAKLGKFDDIPADLRTRHFHTYETIFARYGPKMALLEGELENVWIYGPPGSGKSKHAHATYPDAFWKSSNDKWWDGYKHEDVVVLDDVHPDWTGKHQIKQWADRYPCMVNFKGSMVQIRPKKIVVTSNYGIHEMDFKPLDVPAIERRFKLEYME